MRPPRPHAAAVVTLVGALTLVGLPGQGYAAPACSAPPPPVASAAEVPWPQRQFGLERLAGLADGAGVLVAVIDSGVDSGHPQLAGAVSQGVDHLDAGGDGRLDCVGHGTAVASIIAARSTPGAAFRGVAPAATILPARISERINAGTGRTAPIGAVANALRQVVDRGARVVNMSLTVVRDDPALRDAVQYARTRDVILIAAVGNRRDEGNPRPYPASYPGVVGVGAVQPDGVRTAPSQTGDYVDLVAPGVDVIAAARGGGHTRHSGTSFATAYVAGTAALVRQYHPTLTEAQVAERLIATADPTTAEPADEPPTREPATTAATPSAGTVNPYRAVTARTRDLSAAAPAPVVQPVPDPAARAAAATAVHTRRTAYRLALAGSVLVALLLLAGSALPRAARRRWRLG